MKKSTAIQILILLVKDGVSLAKPSPEDAPFVYAALKAAGLEALDPNELTLDYLNALLPDALEKERLQQSTTQSVLNKLRAKREPLSAPSPHPPKRR